MLLLVNINMMHHFSIWFGMFVVSFRNFCIILCYLVLVSCWSPAPALVPPPALQEPYDL